MATASQKVKVGVFLIVGVVLLAAAVVLTMGIGGEDTKTYYIVFDEPVGGLTAGSVVQYLGVNVGSVEDMLVTEEGFVRVEIKVRPDKVHLKQGVKATLAPQGISGIVYIQLSGGSGRELDEGDTIGTQPSLFGTVDQLMVKIKSTFEELNKTLTSINEKDIAGDIDNTIREISNLLIETRKQISEIGPTIKATLKNADEKIAALDMKQINEDLHAAMTSIEQFADEAGKTLEELRRQVPHARREVLITQQELGLTLRKMRDALANVERLAKGLEEDPSSIIRGKSAGK